MYSSMRMSSVVEELLYFDCLNIKNLYIQSHNLVANGWNFMQLKLSINDHSMMMHVKFHEDSASGVEELLPLDCLIIN